MNLSYVWRAFFIIGGIFLFIGGPQHPGGTMLEMLNDPAWIPAHTWVFFGLLAWTIGLWQFRRSSPASPTLDRWLTFAFVMTLAQTAEMGLHTMAYVDKDALALGESTPVLTTHMWLTAVVYPIFAVSMIGLIWTGQRERLLGSPWIGWIGMIGAVGHGLAGLFVAGFDMAWARPLFPLLVALALWFVLAGFWSIRKTGSPENVDVVNPIEATP